MDNLSNARVRGAYALLSNTVELILTLGALLPRGGPVQDPVLTRGVRNPRVNGPLFRA